MDVQWLDVNSFAVGPVGGFNVSLHRNDRAVGAVTAPNPA